MSTVPEKTNWNAYYSTPFVFSKFTRRITADLAVSLLKKHCPDRGITIAEPGGGNSCFCDRLRREFAASSYCIFEKNETGCRSFLEKAAGCGKAIEGDFLSEISEEYAFDLTVSFGFIEHFTPGKTAEAIAQHFRITRPGGLILMSFPMNLFPYPLIRSCAEKLGIWRFPDERPLTFDEVATTALRYGDVLEKRINRRILLTQGLMLFRKSSAPRKS